MTALADLLLEEVRAMRRELAEFRAEARAHAPHRGDPLMSVLLPAIVGAIGDRVFSLVDLAAMGTLPGNEALARSLRHRCSALPVAYVAWVDASPDALVRTSTATRCFALATVAMVACGKCEFQPANSHRRLRRSRANAMLSAHSI